MDAEAIKKRLMRFKYQQHEDQANFLWDGFAG